MVGLVENPNYYGAAVDEPAGWQSEDGKASYSHKYWFPGSQSNSISTVSGDGTFLLSIWGPILAQKLNYDDRSALLCYIWLLVKVENNIYSYFYIVLNLTRIYHLYLY